MNFRIIFDVIFLSLQVLFIHSIQSTVQDYCLQIKKVSNRQISFPHIFLTKNNHYSPRQAKQTISPNMSRKDFSMSSSKKDQLINQQRKKLEEIRLQTESQNTKLLKIQQKEREVETQYQDQKRNMEETLSKLSLEAQKFMKKQLETTQEFQNQKEQIFSNDRKKETYLKQLAELEKRNQERKRQILDQEKKAKEKKKELEKIRQEIKRYQIYEDFLREVRNISDDFGPNQLDEFSGMSILERYKQMEKKKSELGDLHKKIAHEKEVRAKTIQSLKKLKEEKNMEYGRRLKDLKEQIDQLSDETVNLESELEGKLNENSERQRELGQVIFSIRGLYLGIVGEEKEKHSKGIIEMLKVIKEERKKLTQYLSLFSEKIDEIKKKTEK